MSQFFKTVYFPDYPAESSGKRNIKIAFGKSDREVFKAVKPLANQDLRDLLGFESFVDLQGAATDAGLTVNAFCVQHLRKACITEAISQSPLPGFEEFGPKIDPIQATFRGGKGEPLHQWYPYLEGYSPDFVENIVESYAPQAKYIHDPFSGAGTTPLTVARLGRSASYCELNPLLQYLTTAKIEAHSISVKKREQVVRDLNEIADKLDEILPQQEPDYELRQAYEPAFGKSLFFDDNNFEQVLRLRTLIDEMTYTEPLVGRLLTVTAISALIPSSRLIRRGDLRFRNAKELKRFNCNFTTKVRDLIHMVVADLKHISPFAIPPVLLTSDARDLMKLPQQKFDAVVTSPPYLNGTNYFRNTKVELWFLRCLSSRKDLSRFRYNAITSGINDVTVGKTSNPTTASVEKLVSKLSDEAYDARIPKMVESYFYDMAIVVDGLKYQCSPQAPVIIDIGDSAYSGIHVDTPTLLAEIFEDRGFHLHHEVTLRRRLSRSGHELRQVLLAFKSARRSNSHKKAKKLTFFEQWKDFKQNLPHQKQPYAKRNWGSALHSICSYQGKMKPSLAHHLVGTFVPDGGSILDPFAGVGTIPFEAALMGMKSYAFDVSPAAFAICAAKLQNSTLKTCQSLIKQLAEYIDKFVLAKDDLSAVASFGFNGRIIDYFHKDTFREIMAARSFFGSISPNCPGRNMVLSCMLHILHGNRPYALSRRSHPITPFSPTGETEYRSLIEKLRQKVHRCFDTVLPDQYEPGKCFFQDATENWPNEVGELDAIITSPPFFDSTRFYLANWMRLWFCGWNDVDFKTRPQGFVDERQKHDFAVYEAVFRQSRERLRTGGVMVMHLGKSSKCDMAERLTEISQRWFNVVDLFLESVVHCESHGIRDKGTVSDHSYLVLA
ncbi:MAG: hypothetical protein JW936_03840 [Sedimentisphaerales bacterium]|nr:hypothetical protein [Sedimentisphaerales bacterium]